MQKNIIFPHPLNVSVASLKGGFFKGNILFPSSLFI